MNIKGFSWPLRILWLIELILIIVFLIVFIKESNFVAMFLLLTFWIIGWQKREKKIGKWLYILTSIALMLLVLSTELFLPVIVLFLINSYFTWHYLLKNLLDRFNQDKQFLMLETKDVNEQKYGYVQKRNWLNSHQPTSSVYEWDDIHLTTWFGDTIIDLGNTVLINENNLIVITKAIGTIRVVVPIGVGIELSHSTLKGNVLFEKEEYNLSNQHLKVYSENYKSATRRVKIVTTCYFGNLEVVRT